MDVEIRGARAEEVDDILDVFEATAAEGIWIGSEAPLDRVSRRAGFLATIEKMEAGGPDAMFVPVAEGKIIGSLFIQDIGGGVVGVGMQVASGHRGIGVGTALMRAGIDWASSREGIHKVVLDHWPWNHAGRALYERFGFVEEGYRRRHHRRRDGSLWDSVEMGLVLDHDSPGHPERAADPPGR